MKKQVFALLFVVSLLTCVSAASFTVNLVDKDPIILADTTDPARYIVEITNTGPTDSFEIYSLAGVNIKPSDPITVASGETKRVEIEVTPLPKFRREVKGYFLAEYEVYGQQSGLFKGQLKLKLIDLNNVFEVRAGNLVPGDTEATLTFQSIENYSLNSLPVKIKSPFFEQTISLTLAPYQQQVITLPVDANKASKVVAGTYELTAETSLGTADALKRSAIKYLEKEGLSVSEHTEGLIVRKAIIEKKNEGNVPVTASVTKELDIISRLFTTYAETPTNVTKKGFYVTYVWNRDLQPSESLVVTTSTNYTLPLIFIIIIVGIVVFVKFYNTRSLQIQKRVHAVKTKGGEFALKVSLQVKAHASLSSITLTDRMPHGMMLYEKFGAHPTINEQTHAMSWSIPHLNAGEERVFSYIIYSKMGVVGNFELPLASAHFTHNSKVDTVYSNKTSVMAGIAHNE